MLTEQLSLINKRKQQRVLSYSRSVDTERGLKLLEKERRKAEAEIGLMNTEIDDEAGENEEMKEHIEEL